MKKMIICLLFLISVNPLEAFDRDGYEFHLSAIAGWDPVNADFNQEIGYLAFYAMASLVIDLEDDNAFEIGWGRGKGIFDKDLSIPFFDTAEVSLIRIFDRHRVSAGLSYTFNINSQANVNVYPVKPNFDNTVGWVIAYKYYVIDILDFVSANSQARNRVQQIWEGIGLGFNGMSLGVKYEYKVLEDAVSLNKYNGSTVSYTIDFIF